MSITIPGVPEFLTPEQYVAPLRAIGFDVDQVIEIRYAPDGVHALVAANDSNGSPYVDHANTRIYKHRVFIPVRRESDDERTTRVTSVKN